MLQYERMDESTLSEEKSFTLPEPNPVTKAAHRRDFFRRVTLPLIVGLLILIGIAIAFILIPVGDVETWSQITSILLIGLTMIGGLLVLAFLGGLVYLVSYLLGILPPYTRMAQDGIEQIQEYAEKGADIPVRPVIQVQSFIAAINALFNRRSKTEN